MRSRQPLRRAFSDSGAVEQPFAKAGPVDLLVANAGGDVLAGRYLDAEHDDVDDLLARIDEIRERDLNAIRLQR